MSYINATGSLSMFNIECNDLKFAKMDDDKKQQYAGTGIVYNMKVDEAKKALSADEIALCSANVPVMPQSQTM